MAKYQGYAQRKAYQGSKANLQQPRFQSRFNQDEFAAQQAPREGLTRLQEFHSSVVKSADQHRKDLYNVATDYLKQKQQNQINEARVVEKNQQLDRNLLTTYENSLAHNQNIQAANARLALAEEQQRSKDLQGLIKGVTSTIGVLHDKRREAVRKQVTIDFNTPGSEASKELDKRLGIIRRGISLNNEATTNLAVTAMEEGANPIVVSNIRKPNNYREFVHLELWLKSLGEKATSEIQSQVNLLEESERTSENLQKITQDYLEKNGLVSKDGKQPFVLGNELMSHVLLPMNKTVRSLEQTFQNEEIDRNNEGHFETFINSWSSDPTNPENKMNDVWKRSRLLTNGGKFLTPQEALKRVGDVISTIDPKYYHLYKKQGKLNGNTWETARVGDQSLFEYAEEKWKARKIQEAQDLEDQAKINDTEYSERVLEAEKDIPEDQRLDYWIKNRQELEDLQKNSSNWSTYEKSIKLVNFRINYLTELNLGHQDISKVIPHTKDLAKMGNFTDIVTYIDTNPHLNKEQKQFLRTVYIPFTGELNDSGVTEQNIREQLEPTVLAVLKINRPKDSLTFKQTMNIAVGKYYNYYDKDREGLDNISGPIPFNIIRGKSSGALGKVVAEIQNAEQNPESEFHVGFNRLTGKREFKNQIPSEEKAKEANLEIQKRVDQQQQALAVQSSEYGFGDPIFSKEEAQEIYERYKESGSLENILPTYIEKALEHHGLSIPMFINMELYHHGLVDSTVPLDVPDYLEAGADRTTQPNYCWYAYHCKTNATAHNLDVFHRKFKVFWNERIKKLNLSDKYMKAASAPATPIGGDE